GAPSLNLRRERGPVPPKPEGRRRVGGAACAEQAIEKNRSLRASVVPPPRPRSPRSRGRPLPPPNSGLPPGGIQKCRSPGSPTCVGGRAEVALQCSNANAGRASGDAALKVTSAQDSNPLKRGARRRERGKSFFTRACAGDGDCFVAHCSRVYPRSPIYNAQA